MRSASGGPRVLLRRLRETMAEQVSAQERLDKIVVLIAANMVAEVCSTYVLRVDNTLELYATEGLNRDAVHRTVLSAHEGLVGLVASEATPLNLSRRAKPSGVLVPPGNRRRNLSFVPRRADPARRQHARRAGGAEPRQAHLCRGRGRGAADHRHGAGGDDRLRRTGGAGAARRRARGAAFRCTRPARSCPTASRSAMWCCTSRASSSPITLPRTCRRKSSGSTRRWPSCAPISTACWSAATSPKAASIATCWKPTACSPTTTAGRTSCMRRSPPASPRKPPSSACSPTPARACCARPIPICATACMTSRISAIA